MKGQHLAMQYVVLSIVMDYGREESLDRSRLGIAAATVMLDCFM